MKTPKEYTNNLKNNIITKEMLLTCLYSSNKRAKNYRDKERQYREYRKFNRYFYDKYDNEGKMKEKKEEYYKQKEILLSIINPICIHKELYGYEKERIYDYEKRYKKYLKKGLFVWENCFWNSEIGCEIWFGDIELKDSPLYHYYYFYDLGMEYTFHSPIDEDELETIISEKRLKIVEIDQLNTEGKEITNLISNQFVIKVIKLIQTKNYTLKDF